MFNTSFTISLLAIASVLGASQVGFLVAKLSHYVTFSWWLVLTPLWIAILLLCGLIWLLVYIASQLS